MGVLRGIEIAQTDRGFRVSCDYRNRAAAIAGAHALFNAPSDDAFESVTPAQSAALNALVAESQRLGLYDVPELAPEVEARVYADVDDAAPVPMEHAEAVSR